MLRRPAFWLLFAATSLLCTVFALRNFSLAFPVVSLDLRMDRAQALEKAGEIASRLQLPPQDSREVASFEGDQLVQNFVELEGGGREAFRSMIASGYHHPYTWTVRRYRPGETRETRIRLTPEGIPYGFSVKLPEDEAGAALEEAEALEIAERGAAVDWSVDLGLYRLTERSREVRPGGRVDHTFVYERPDLQAGEGRYRLRLVVGGDRLIQLTRFVKVPEAFSRRYEEMRSANEAIGIAGSIAFALFYLVGGCGFGIFYLMRQRSLLLRTPVIWGTFIALLQLLAGINEWPLSWMQYDTALSTESFVARQVTQLVLVFLGYAFLLSISFVAAEGLSRMAFPNHIQQWRLWSRGVAATREVLGRTAAGYLLVGVFFAYEVALYFLTSRGLGWWMPSDTLVQPDVLATYFPWLSSIAISAQAGFWEESVFRAIPIAAAALLGSKFGRRGWWIAGAMVLQALIFGAGHAGYANQPSYARMVELIVPSLMFGGLYLCFGLLPAVVLHFTFDVVWFALPLFVSRSEGVWADCVLVVVLTLVPLWVVLAARLRAGRWGAISKQDTNGVWRPPVATHVEAAEMWHAPATLRPALTRIFPLCGVLGIAAWVLFTSFESDAPPLQVGRLEAQRIARRALEDRGLQSSTSWQPLASVEGRPGSAHRFVWQTAGEETYRGLLGEYLPAPHWRVRFVRFEGDVAERAEEYQVFVDPDGQTFRIRHALPEARAGSTLTEEAARFLALAAIEQRFEMDPAALREISAVPSKLKSRSDWEFTFSVVNEPALPQGERRVTATIAGDEVTDVYRSIHIPEEWSRRERERQVIPSVINIACLVALGMIVALGVGMAVVYWSRKRFSVAAFLAVFGSLLPLRIVGFANSLPGFTSQFSTAQPYKLQLAIILVSGVLGALVQAGAFGLLAGLSREWINRRAPALPPRAVLLGASAGAVAAGLAAAAATLKPSLSPDWPPYGILESYSPWLQSGVDPVTAYIVRATVALMIFGLADWLTGSWQRRRIIGALLLFLCGPIIAGTGPVEAVASWMISGAVMGLVLLAGYWLLLRHFPPLALIAVAVMSTMDGLSQGLCHPCPQSIPMAIVGIILISTAARFYYRKMSAQESPAR